MQGYPINNRTEMSAEDLLGDGYELMRAEQPRRVDVYHHRDDDGPRITLGLEKNTKGYNWSVTVTGNASLDTMERILYEAELRLRGRYGQGEPERL